MKKFMKRYIAMLLVMVFLVPTLWNQKMTVASGAVTPSFTNTKVEISGIGQTYQMTIKNKIAKSKYKWSTSNNLVATVNSKGLITTVGKGTAVISCKITYPTKKSKTLTCNVTVSIPSTGIRISNATLVNGAYQVTVGGKVDLDTVISPDNSSDTTYWFVDPDSGDPGCVSVVDAEKGIITGVKPGKAVLRVKTAKTATKEAADLSDIQASVIIEVVQPTATVKSVDITSSNTISVVFSSPVQKSTVIGNANNLLDNIAITGVKDARNLSATDPGVLKASLSDDLMTLTITTTNMLKGDYRITVTNKILSMNGVAIDNYIKTISYVDVNPPYITGVTMDDSGVIDTINFSEVIDVTGFKVSYVTAAGEFADPATVGILNVVSNYVLSADKKSMKINLSNIATSDFGKSFTVMLSGIKDQSGNFPATAYLTAKLITDKTQKPQAQLISITRTSYYTLTATFSRSIQYGGYLAIENGSSIPGLVDQTDNKKVNYTISENDAKYIGSKSVSVSFWNSYNVIPSDMTGKTPVTRVISFDVDKTAPGMTNNVYDATTGILTLTFNEKVNLTTVNGVFSARLATTSGIVTSGKNLSYSMVTHNDGNNIIKVKLTGMDVIGYYSFDLGLGFVTDDFMNKSANANITINNSASGTELPGPFRVNQMVGDPNKIVLEFSNMLDLVSAQSTNNYTITGAVIQSAEVTSNSSTGATVVLTVKEGSIDVTVERVLSIKGVSGYNGSFSPITTYTKSITLMKNKKSYFLSPPIFDSSARNIIKLNFSDTITGSLAVNVYAMNNSSQFTQVPNSVSISGNTAYINLGIIPLSGTWLKIEIVNNNLTDMTGNGVTFDTNTLGVGVSY
jgi:Bacterial Ig-like domain (group 2).